MNIAKERAPGLSKSAAVRAQLDHPVIDCDGHCIEFLPYFHEYLTKIGGRAMSERFRKARIGEQMTKRTPWHTQSVPERLRESRWKRAFWSLPAGNTLDRATAMLPALLYQRLDEFGIDFSIVYPTAGIEVPFIKEPELRRAAARALNTMQADVFREFRDRMTPVATIPTTDPREAIDELEYCVKTLGLKAIMITGNVHRAIPVVDEKAPELARYAPWFDHMAIDSLHDYDPFWARCVALGVAPTAHAGHQGVASHRSVTSYVYNHIGSFAEANHAFCKAVFLGGVTKRFPTLRFGFLEGGVGWACNLLADTIGHWEKRNREAIKHLDPRTLDVAKLKDLFLAHGGQMVKGREGELDEMLARYAVNNDNLPEIDEFAACGANTEADIRHQFRNYFFGCEADDSMNVLAFRDAARDAHLQAMFSSDISHWDVPDMSETVEEAYELVEDHGMNMRSFRDFMFVNPARLHAGMNPDFFKGTRVEGAVDKLKAAGEL